MSGPAAALRRLGAPALLLLAAGGALAGRAAYLQAKAALAGLLVERAWSETVATGRDTPPWPWADMHPVGRLRIPAVGYDAVVLDPASPRTLAFGPAHLQNGAAPGEEGNVVLTGHRTSDFRALERVGDGDEILLEWRRRGAGTRVARYRVSAVRVVAPDDVAALRPTLGETLTLVTCYPFGPRPASTHRYVVRATPVRDG